jgi:hypothetical protein
VFVDGTVTVFLEAHLRCFRGFTDVQIPLAPSHKMRIIKFDHIDTAVICPAIDNEPLSHQTTHKTPFGFLGAV